MTVREGIAFAAGALEVAGVDTPRVDAEVLLGHALGLGRTDLYAAGDRELAPEEEARFRGLVARRTRREPAAYILGEWGFRRLALRVSPYVLVPRPETEVVVERCLARLAGREAPRVLDVGTGSGAIALSIADEHPGARVIATDISAGALAVAAENRARLGLDERVELVHGHLDAHVPGPFDLVVSNPPYVEPGDFDALQPEIRLFEPREAVVGVGVTQRVAEHAMGLLAPGGWLVLECGDGQADGLAAALRELGYLDVVASPDLTGRDRVVEGRRP
ncbi:MAG: peptide chain release factor N(5)-glutamine methyltransferase [Thermoleophilia bacterium]